MLPELMEKSRRERFKVHFNFITLHCESGLELQHFPFREQTLTCTLDCYLIGMILILSVVIFTGSNIRYIDALFFASGACTQSGLNT